MAVLATFPCWVWSRKLDGCLVRRTTRLVSLRWWLSAMAYGVAPMAPIRAFSAVPSGSTVIPLPLLGFCRPDFAILDRRLPAKWKCLAPADLLQIPFPSHCVVTGFLDLESDDLSLADRKSVV